MCGSCSLIKSNIDINTSSFFPSSESEARFWAQVWVCVLASVFLQHGFKESTGVIGAGDWLWSLKGGLITADVENSSGRCLSPERRQRDWLVWRKSRFTESRLGRSRESPSFFSPNPRGFTLFDGIAMIIVATAAGFCSRTKWTDIWSMLYFIPHKKQ